MGARRSQVAVLAGVLLASALARADQVVQLQLPGLEVVVPDGWTYEVSESADTFRDAAGALIGKVVIAQESCSDATARIALGQAFEMTGPIFDPPAGWSGFSFVQSGAPVTIHCREALIMGVGLQVILLGYSSDAATLLGALSAGVNTVEGGTTAAPEPDDATTHKLYVVVVSLRIQAPTNWTSDYSAGYEWVKRNGKLVAKVAGWNVDCKRALKQGGVVSVDFPGWTKIDFEGNRGYCHQTGKAFVEFTGDEVGWFLTAIGEALERRRIANIPTPFERFGPNRYEFGLGRFDADPNDLFVKEGWGVALAAGKTPWRSKPGLTWSYMARLLATGEGSPGSVDAGIGVNLKLIALQAIAGAGAAGDPAPLAVHAGAQFDLLFLKAPGGGFDFSASRVWFDGGHATRLGGAFLLAGSHRAYALSFGWDSRGGTSTFTFNLMTMRLPPSE